MSAVVHPSGARYRGGVGAIEEEVARVGITGGLQGDERGEVGQVRRGDCGVVDAGDEASERMVKRVFGLDGSFCEVLKNKMYVHICYTDVEKGRN